MLMTARGLLDELYAATDRADSARIFAGRVESVLALQPREWAGYDACLAEVRAILDGKARGE
jgi:hypothetical protein